MNRNIVNLTVCLMLFAPSLCAGNSNFMSRAYPAYFCEFFAWNAFQAAEILKQGVRLPEVLHYIENATVTEEEKDRAFQAVQFVWKNQFDNPQLAYTLAMGLCLQPKKEMSPMAEPWLTSPRTSREHF